ncbi:DsbA family protein [Polymorphospora rubra]|uniref:DsbA family protein n=1 Tax=Polymorphospora rubra TaxID=338584 RepID=UPI0033EA3C52
MSSRAGQKRAAKVVRQQMARERRRQRTLWTSVVAVAALVVAGMIGWGVFASQRADEYHAPTGATADGSGIAVGTGPVTVDVYEDFMCPACRQFETQFGPVLDQLVADGRVRVVHHPVAYLDRASTTDYSSRSSAAAGCAADGGRYGEYSSALFERQPPEGGAGLSTDELIRIGGGVGLDEDTFGTCIRDGKFRTWTAHVTDLASERGVRGTPTVFVDGQPVQNNAEAIRAAIDAAGR